MEGLGAVSQNSKKRWRGFYRGALFGTFALLPGHCVWYLAYEGSKWHLTPFFPERTAPAAAAAVAECCYVACAMPVENVVVRIQCRKASAPQLRWGASLQELRRLWQDRRRAACGAGGMEAC